MCGETECNKCEYSEDLKGCVTKHVGEARKRIAEGNSEGADLQLNYLEKHLKE